MPYKDPVKRLEMNRIYNKRWSDRRREQGLGRGPDAVTYNKRYGYALKQEMITAYGGKCSCPGCTVTEPEFLTLDHPNGDGAADRRRRKTNGGYGMYLQLKREGWPQTFRLLCWNCNCAIGRYGYCPHSLN